MSSGDGRLATHLLVRDQGGKPFWELKFREGGRQVKRRIGPAWLAKVDTAQAKPGGKTYKSGAWVQRRGRPAGGALSYDDAVAVVPSLLDAYREAQAASLSAADDARREAERPRTFAELARAWREWLDRKGTKPSTLVGYDGMLAQPGEPHRRGQGTRVGYIMAALGPIPAIDVGVGDVEALLRGISETGASPRTVEKHRIMVRSILNYGIRQTKRARAGKRNDGFDYGLEINAAQVAESPRQRATRRLVYYRPDEIEAIAQAMEHGHHRQPQTHHQPGCKSAGGSSCDCKAIYRVGAEAFTELSVACAFLREYRDEHQRRSDLQDAAAVRLSAYTGMRLGELLALRWSDIDWTGTALNVNRAISAGGESTTKSGKARRIPLPDQALTALKHLAHRGDFTAPDQLVVCNITTGRYLDGSALRRRYKAAQRAADVHPMRWHDLRHTYGSLLAASGEELVTIKAAMGHANITTTEIYLHAQPATEAASRFTQAFTVRPTRGG